MNCFHAAAKRKNLSALDAFKTLLEVKETR